MLQEMVIGYLLLTVIFGGMIFHLQNELWRLKLQVYAIEDQKAIIKYLFDELRKEAKERVS